MTLRVLCIDDDRRLFELLVSYLGPNGIVLSHAADGKQGLTALQQGVFDAVLLDVMMPGMDGVEVCRRIRERSRIPIIMLTARGDEADRVVGLEIGADDYVPKPFSPRELLARLRAVLRRTNPAGAGERISVAGLEIDVSARRVRRGEGIIDLTAIEFDLFLALARRPGRVVPRDLLLSEAGRTDVTVSDRTVDVHVSHLRRKLGDDSRAPALIKTVRGVGYVLSAEGRSGSDAGDGPLP
jgi:DNA-binding response OmpR family regulator